MPGPGELKEGKSGIAAVMRIGNTPETRSGETVATMPRLTTEIDSIRIEIGRGTPHHIPRDGKATGTTLIGGTRIVTLGTGLKNPLELGWPTLAMPALLSRMRQVRIQ